MSSVLAETETISTDRYSDGSPAKSPRYWAMRMTWLSNLPLATWKGRDLYGSPSLRVQGRR